jgi:dUTPase
VLKVIKLNPKGLLPTVNHPGADLGYDLYATENTMVRDGASVRVPTGITAWYECPAGKFGLLIRDRSSMAVRGFTVSGGVIDADYRGELVVLLKFNSPGMTDKERVLAVYPEFVAFNWSFLYSGEANRWSIGNGDTWITNHYATEAEAWASAASKLPAGDCAHIKAGDRIAQMIPLPVMTHGAIVEVKGERGDKGLGSSGR